MGVVVKIWGIFWVVVVGAIVVIGAEDCVKSVEADEFSAESGKSDGKGEGVGASVVVMSAFCVDIGCALVV